MYITDSNKLKNVCPPLHSCHILVTEDKVNCQIFSFRPYKLPGPDEMFPALVQQDRLVNKLLELEFISRHWSYLFPRQKEEDTV